MQNLSHEFDFGSDFYHEEDDTTRGVTLGPATSWDLPDCGGIPDVDDALCKHLPGDKTWAMSTRAISERNSSPLAMPTLERGGFGTENMAIMTDRGGIDGPAMMNSGTSAEELNFSTALPSPMPFGGCAATSVHLERVAPADAMNTLYTFFQTERAASITKLRLQKCSMIASVVVQDTDLLSNCVVKARIYWADQTGQKLVVEFRRRDGDPLAFQRVFARAAACLRGGSAAPPLVEEPCSALSDVEIESLQPCVDMLAKAPSQAGQLEAIIALAVLAQKNSKMAVAVSAAVTQLQGLLCALETSPLFNVAYTTSLLTSRLMSESAPSSSPSSAA
jgi:hypothetical protein